MSTETENESDKESTKPEPVNVKKEVTEEIKTKKQSHMKEFLKDTYNKIDTKNIIYKTYLIK